MGVLSDIKDMVGVDPEAESAYDAEILTHINSALSTLAQNGAVEPGYMILDDSDEWSDFVPDNILGHTKQYVFLQVKSLFDTSTTPSYVLECFREQAKEALWYIREEIENGGDQNG